MNAPDKAQMSGGPVTLLPTREFFTPEYYALEKERIFKKSWIRVGTEPEIPNVGDYFVKEMGVCDTSVIVVRGRDERIRAFHNSCSHRSNRVAYQESGNTKSFVCRFHGWAFGLDGSLRAVLEERFFPDLKKEEHGLVEVACEVWEGQIFVNVDPKPEQTLREYLGEEIYNGFNGFFRSHGKRISKCTMVMEANWKVCVDAFTETYHFSSVHVATIGDVILNKDFPNGRAEAFREYSNTRAISITSNNIGHVPTFTEMLVGKYLGKNLTVAGDRDKPPEHPPQVNPNKDKDWVTELMVIFPTTDLQPFPGFHAAMSYWPLSHDRTLFELEVYFEQPQNAASEVVLEYNRALMRDVVREDLQNMAWIQTNLNSGVQRYQVLSDLEAMVQAHYRRVAKYVGHGW